MFDNATVFSWHGIILGAIVFGFLFESIFLLTDYLLDKSVGVDPVALGFGAFAAVGYVLAGAVVRRNVRSDRGRKSKEKRESSEKK